MAVSTIIVKKVLLWTNPNPTSNFVAQTILTDVDFTQFDEIEIWAYLYTGFQHFVPIIKIPVGSQGNITGVAGVSGETSGVGYILTRGVRSNNSYINIAEGYGCATNGGNWVVNNGNAIPYKIYGIKNN